MEPHRLKFGLELSCLFPQKRGVRSQFVAAEARRIARRIEPLELQLQ